MNTDRPTTRAWLDRPLKVAIEDQPGSRVFKPDPRCAVEQLTIGSDGRISTAVIRVWPGPTTPGAGDEEALDPATFLNAGPRSGFGTFLSCDQEILIYRECEAEIDEDEEAGAELVWEPIFSGTCDLPEYAEQSNPDGSSKVITLHVEGPLSRLSDAPYAQIVGRHMRTANGQDSLDKQQERNETTAFGPQADVAAVPAMACIFNARGKPNCAAAPIEAQLGDETIEISAFTQDEDADAVYWTWAKALRYLLYFHLFTAHDPITAIIFDGDGFDSTEELQGQDYDERPKPPVELEEAWDFAMLTRPSSFVVDRMNLVEALTLLADAAGIHFRVATELVEDENGNKIKEPRNRMYFWARGAGEVITLNQKPAATGQSAGDVLAGHDLNALTIRVDYGDCLPAPKAIGDVRRYEIKTELVPGWLPDAHLDDVEDAAEERKFWEPHQTESGDKLLADTWYRHYHRSGDLFAQYASVGRRWILPVDGTYPANNLDDENIYARDTGPFVADKYKLWEPSDCEITDTRMSDAGTIEKVKVEKGAWSRRRRPFLPCFSADGEGRSLGIVVQVSFDAGATWHRIQALAARAVTDDSAIQFDADDLTAIFEPGEDGPGYTSFWQAMINGTARVRVTCVIEGDERLTPNLQATPFNAPVDGLSRLFDVSEKFHSNRRDGGNSQFRQGQTLAAPAETAETGDDLAAIQAYGEHLLETCTARQQAGALRVPWITFDYHPGQSIKQIAGFGLDFYSHADESGRRYPDIVGVTYAGTSTLLALDDFRVADEMLSGAVA